MAGEATIARIASSKILTEIMTIAVVVNSTAEAAAAISPGPRLPVSGAPVTDFTKWL